MLWIFRSRQLDPVFTPKAEITGPADHSSKKKKKKVEVQRTTLRQKTKQNMKLNNKIIFLVRKRTIISQHQKYEAECLGI